MKTRIDIFFCASAAIFLAGCTPSLHDLIGRGELEEVRARLEANPELVRDANRIGKQPLQYAVMYRQLDAMEALVAAGADVNAGDDTGMTALQMAVVKNWKEGVVWLLEHGADPAQTDDFGDLASHTAAIWGRGGILGILDERGVSLTAKNHEGKTPQELARKHRHERTAERLAQLTK